MLAVTGYYVDPAGNYYEGDRVHVLDTAVPQRPDSVSRWNTDFHVWEPDPAKQAVAAAAGKLIADRDVVATTPEVQQLVAMTPSQIQTYIALNVVDLPSARKVLLTLALIVRTLAIKSL